VTSKVDRELAKIEERRAEVEAEALTGPPKRGIRAAVKRAAKNIALRRVSTKRAVEARGRQ
jgi:hypothetical protein